MKTDPSELAFLRIAPDRFAVGRGPFTAAAAPPPDRAAFYRNDFFLSDWMPWKIPERFEIVSKWDLDLQTSHPIVEWAPLDPDPFRQAFEHIFRAFQNGSRLEKMVPVVTERGHLLSGDPRHWAQHLIHFAKEPLWSYGMWSTSGGFCGATPEKLLTVTRDSLESMALAGTAIPSRIGSFQQDAKQIHEHELVVKGLEEALGSMSIQRGRRRLLEMEHLVHFLTIFQGVRPEKLDLGRLLESIHPTPAVGVYPRSPKTEALLAKIRVALRAPSQFGAPFGIWHDDEFHGVVAIRQIAWDRSDLALPVGCGLVPQSVLDHEWRELELKRHAVKASLGIAS